VQITTAGDQQAGGEQQRVTGQKEPDEQARLGEDQHQDADHPER
jgi:hypothetical protein